MRIPPLNFTQIPNILLDEWLPRLGDVELKVLLVIMRQTFGWQKTREKISLSFFQNITGCSRTNISKALNFLIEKGLVRKDIIGSLGTEDVYYELVVSNERGSTESVPPPSTDSTPPLVLNQHPSSMEDNTYRKEKTKEKGNVKTMPLPSEKNQGKTQYPLKKEQLEIFNQIKDLDLKADDDTLKILIRVYGIEKISNAICHMKAEDFKGTVFKKPRIAFFRHLLAGKAAIISNRAEENRRRLQTALKKCSWQSLEIHDKYIICRNCMKEISLDLDKKEFDSQLNTLYETSKIYGN